MCKYLKELTLKNNNVINYPTYSCKARPFPEQDF